MVMMRLPPGVPSTPTLSSPMIKVGVMELSGRLKRLNFIGLKADQAEGIG